MCTPHNIPYPVLPGVRFTSLSASLASNLTVQIPESVYLNNGAVDAQGINLCNITTTYTHVGESDTVTVEIYLPTDSWNGRMQAIGGGGFSAGGTSMSLVQFSMLGAVSEGYSAVTTDAGHASLDPADWVLLKPGSVNLPLLEEFGSTSLNELSIIGKAITESYYGKPPSYSYWNGCSQGGRQGMKLAEKYPTAFDGIAASAPGIDLPALGVADHWAQVVMKALGQYPNNCEFLAITEALIDHCDGNDGIVDGILSDPDSCDFDPYSIVNKTFDCRETDGPRTVVVSEAAVKVANAAWTGARKRDGSSLWWGLKKGTRLVEEVVSLGVVEGLATTICSQNGTCVGKPMGFVSQWIQLLIKKDPTFDISTVDITDIEDLFRESEKEYSSIFNVEPNLDAFRDAGGKMVSYHGLADGIVPPDSTRGYYGLIAAKDKRVHDYYRLFEAPGLAHCFSATGGYYPAGIFKALVSWVESDIAPDSLAASTPPQNGTVRNGLLCPYPQKAHYTGSGFNITTDDFHCA